MEGASLIEILKATEIIIIKDKKCTGSEAETVAGMNS